MPVVAVRWVAAVAGLALAACNAGGDALSPAESAYLTGAASRRHALEASLVDRDNAYSQLRLAHYASGDALDWDLLPEWNPRVAPVMRADLDAPAPTTSPATARALDDGDAQTVEALRALGEAAFFLYPTQLAPAPTISSANADAEGLWLDDARGVGGLVHAEAADGSVVLGLSCATCHADVVGGRLAVGLPSARFDLGRMFIDAGVPSTLADRLAAWGPGRVDVTTPDGSLPERISDLRPVRWLSHLQYDATVAQSDVVALAIRLETLIITVHGQTVRPPRRIALGLAIYLWSLSDDLGPPPNTSSPGARTFASTCSGCHAGPALTGPPRPLAEVGTDPTLGLSPDRGTGFYRVPSLRGVSTRPTLFHDGTLADVDALLDPARLSPTYTGGARGAGAVSGHPFGLDLAPADRAALLAYLRSL
ncbi:MAG TPA: hypothetical protein VHJ20_21415 [Polyangia bacterium]|nr:hypothetical protein [Polyangia bacterium]